MVRFVTKNIEIMVRFVTKNTEIMVRFVTKDKKILYLCIKNQQYVSTNRLISTCGMVEKKRP